VTGAISATGGGGSITAATTLNAPTLTITNGTASGSFTGLTLQSKANGATAGYVPPVYTNAGAALGATTHIVAGTFSTTTNGGCSAFTNCALTASAIAFSGSAQFTTTISCTVSNASVSGTGPQVPWAIGVSTTGFSLGIWNAQSGTLSGGTNVGVDYICAGY
jgi:hypothetical protein